MESLVFIRWFSLIVFSLAIHCGVKCQSTCQASDDGCTTQVSVEMKSLTDEIRQLRQQLDTTIKTPISCQNSTSTITDGWTYLPAVQKYYRVIFELVDWDTADSRCRELGTKSHLIAVNNSTENEAIRMLLSSFGSAKTRLCHWPDMPWEWYHAGYWTSGQLSDRTRCGSASNPWVWKPYPGTKLQMTYTNWNSGEPNCAWFGTEQCVYSFLRNNNLHWNDINCAWQMCPICELDN